MPHANTENLTDIEFMREALYEARLAAQEGEVPIGAVLVSAGRVVGRGRNRTRTPADPTAHAEIEALRDAARQLDNYRLASCTLYVTVEPCTMCAGAILNARLQRVVYGATEPKTGAAGSIHDVFSDYRLNHQTSVQTGVLADECAQELVRFFAQRRAQHKFRAWPLRDDAVRTPDSAFALIPDYPWEPNYIDDLPALRGLRMHYLDVRPAEADPAGRCPTYVCLHGNPAWSYLYRKMIPVLADAGHRVLAPDLIGFGRSDKPKRADAHSFTWHRSVLLEWIERMDLRDIVLVLQDWGGILGLTLPMHDPSRYRGLLIMNTTLACGDEPLPPGFIAWRDMCQRKPEFDIAALFARGNPHLNADECRAYAVPFPDAGYRAALRAFPPMVPERAECDGASWSRLARDFFAHEWHGKTLMAVGDQDPVLGPPVMMQLHRHIKGCPPPIHLPEAGHFVPEYAGELARRALQYFAS